MNVLMVATSEFTTLDIIALSVNISHVKMKNKYHNQPPRELAAEN